MILVKALGLFLVVSVCSLIGFLKGQSIKSRYKKICTFCGGLDDFYEYIEQGDCDLKKAIKNAFDRCDFLYHSNQSTFCYDNDLNGEDKAIIDSFFLSLGHSAKKAECDRIKLCKIKMQKRQAEAEGEMNQKCKIYNTFGVCIGLGLAVLLI